MDIYFDIYLTNVQNKQTLQIYNFFWNKHSFSKNDAEGCEKKELKYEIMLYNSTELSVDWTSRWFQNQTISFSMSSI